jgi:hypothetical protein
LSYQNFFGWSAGAAATLLGLLFIAVQVGFRRFRYDRTKRRHAVASSTLGILLTLFISSMMFLYPGLELHQVAQALIVICAFGLFRIVLTWRPVYRSMLGEAEGASRRMQTVWLLLGPGLVYVLVIAFSALQLTSSQLFLAQAVAGGYLGLFSIAIRNAWQLVSQPDPEDDDRGSAPG